MVASLVCLFVYAGMQGGLKGFTQGKSSGNFWSCTFCPGFSGPKCGPVSGPASGARSRFTGGSTASALGAETLAPCDAQGISPDSTVPRMGHTAMLLAVYVSRVQRANCREIAGGLSGWCDVGGAVQCKAGTCLRGRQDSGVLGDGGCHAAVSVRPALQS